MLRGQNGITLVALVVTIVILIILATISISIVQEGGLINRAEKAKDAYRNGDTAFNEMSNDAQTKIDAHLANYANGL